MLRPLTGLKTWRLPFGKDPPPRASQMRPPVVELLVARLAECRDLESLLRDAGRRPTPSDPDLHAERLGEIRADLVLYTGLLSERVARAGRQVAGTEPAATDDPSHDGALLGAAIAALARGMRRGVEEAERLGDDESAALLDEIARVADTWVWHLDAPPLAPDSPSASPTAPVEAPR